MRGRRSGESREVTVGFVGEPDGSILVAAGALDRAWAANLLADPAVDVTVAGRSFVGEADILDDRDPRRGRAVRELILRYGTPSERRHAAEDLATSTWSAHPSVTQALASCGRDDPEPAVRATCLRCLAQINFNKLPQ